MDWDGGGDRSGQNPGPRTCVCLFVFFSASWERWDSVQSKKGASPSLIQDVITLSTSQQRKQPLDGSLCWTTRQAPWELLPTLASARMWMRAQWQPGPVCVLITSLAPPDTLRSDAIMPTSQMGKVKG